MEVSRSVGNRVNTSFWSVPWRGEVALCVKYPRLFSISNQKEASIIRMGGTNVSFVVRGFGGFCLVTRRGG